MPRHAAKRVRPIEGDFREGFRLALAGLPDVTGASTYRYWRRRMNAIPRPTPVHPMTRAAQIFGSTWEEVVERPDANRRVGR